MDYYDLMLRNQRLALLATLFFALTGNAQTVDEKRAPPPMSGLDSQLFYQLILGELTTQAGDPGAGYSLILDAARKTRDAGLYQRAVAIALQARSGDSALLAARAWQQALPDSKEANRFILQILIGLNRITEALEPLKREIAATNPNDRPLMVGAIPRLLSRASDKKQAADLVEQALKPYLAEPIVGIEAWTVIGRMRVDAGDVSGALAAVRRAQAIDANAEGPVRLALSVMSLGAPEAELIIKKYLEEKQRPPLRMAYARALLGEKRYEDAATQLQAVTYEQPDDLEAWLLRGALELQDEKPLAAERSFKRYLDLSSQGKIQDAATSELNKGLTQALLSLSQIAEQRKDFMAAEEWLRRIDRPEDKTTVQFRRASLLARQGRLTEARELIRNQPENSSAEARMKIMAEAQLLRDNKKFNEAYELLSEANRQNGEDLDLAYDLAMVAEKLGNITEMERLLRLIIASKPDYHHAYNALGYSLAERNVRLPEARQLVLKALDLAPSDPFILDSLGWVEFRSGNLEEARRILQSAFEAKPDAEIAAHLGEVLWAMDRKSQAIAIWKEGGKLNAQNETLQETLKRLGVRP
ncbi:MAG: tetratricopeptide repeat protein [Rhodoferax sp.]|nr:tetratricopeptide repeat protein [Rhodoferax sp.]